jgi:hypothetical protein
MLIFLGLTSLRFMKILSFIGRSFSKNERGMP